MAAALFLLLTAGCARAQFFGAAAEIHYVSVNPAGACLPRFITLNILTGDVYGCVNSVWTLLLAGGSGASLWGRNSSGSAKNLYPLTSGDDITSLPTTNGAVGGGIYNNAIGAGALASNAGTGSANTAIGHDALTNSTGDDNIGVGRKAAEANTTGDNNIAVGSYALDANTTGNDNVAVGNNSLYFNAAGDGNTAIGHHAGENQTGTYGTFIGNGAGPLYASPARTYNTAIGAGTKADCDNCVVIGRLNGLGQPLDTVRVNGPIIGDGSQLTGVAAGNSNAYAADGLVSGGAVAWTQTGLAFRVGAAAYIIGGTRYTSAETTLTLGAAHASNPRIDVIAVNSSGAAVVVAGTAAASPSKPAVDPDSQIELSFVYVAATATTPSQVTVSDIYHENVEWTATKSGGLVVNSTNNPHAGSLDVEATTAATGDYVKFTAGAAFDPATRSSLVLYIRSKATWPSTRNLQLAWYNSNTRKGTAVTLADGAFGFSSATTSAYQQIVVPLSLFQAAGLSVDNLRIIVGGTGTTLGFYLDDLTLQGGVTAPSAATAIMRGLVFTFDGGGAALATGRTAYLRIPFACTLSNWSIQSTTSETVTAKVWLVSGGTAVPTVSNVINTSGVSLTSGGFILSSNLSDFSTTAIPADAQIAATLTAVTASQFVNLTLGCRQ